jgi:hypothetical protein
VATTNFLPYNRRVPQNKKKLLLGALILSTVVFVILVIATILMSWKSPELQQQRGRLNFEQQVAVLAATIENKQLRSRECPELNNPSRAACFTQWLEVKTKDKQLDAAWKIFLVRAAAKLVAADLRETGATADAAIETEKGIELMELVAQIIELPEQSNTRGSPEETKTLARSGMLAVERTLSQIPERDPRRSAWQLRVESLRTRFARHAL